MNWIVDASVLPAFLENSVILVMTPSLREDRIFDVRVKCGKELSL